jgi:hypothetical protein
MTQSFITATPAFSGTLPLDFTDPDTENVRTYIRWVAQFAHSLTDDALDAVCNYFVGVPADQRDAHYRLTSQAMLRESARRF